MSNHDVQNTPAPVDDPAGERRTSGGAALTAGVAGVLLLALVAVVALATRDAEQPAEDLRDEQVSEQVYSEIRTGQTKEDVLQRLQPAEPLDSSVLAEYQSREPETPAAECVYFESAGGVADDKYRFCFVQDELVDKTVVLPAENGVTGS